MKNRRGSWNFHAEEIFSSGFLLSLSVVAWLHRAMRMEICQCSMHVICKLKLRKKETYLQRSVFKGNTLN